MPISDSITIQRNNLMPLVDDLRQINNRTRNRVAVKTNTKLTLMYWHIGELINREVLGNERTECGKQIVATVSAQLMWSHITEIFTLKERPSAGILPGVGCFRKMVYSPAAQRPGSRPPALGESPGGIIAK